MSTHAALTLGAFVVLCLVVGGIGGMVTAGGVREWYPTLRKPAWTPPSWLFAPVWTLLYVLMGVAAWLVWEKTGFGIAIALFAVQLMLNFLWSFFFFGLKRPGMAAVEIVLLWDAIVATIVLFALVDPIAASLLIPYLVWVSFASALNISIWRANS